MSAIDRLHTTAESHRRTLICEVMGRNAGWIAFHAGLSGGANVILIPELEFDLDRVCDYIVRRFESQYSPIVVVAEGAQPKGGMPEPDGAPTDSFGHVRLGGIANWLEGEIEQRTGHEARATVLGHIQRGGTPTAFDRVLATRFGLHAIDAAHEGQWGKMTALRSTDIRLVDLSEATAELKTVPESLYREAEVFFG
jgi:6-phosphofructokinase 1